jgi:hypothetical protein
VWLKFYTNTSIVVLIVFHLQEDFKSGAQLAWHSHNCANRPHDGLWYLWSVPNQHRAQVSSESILKNTRSFALACNYIMTLPFDLQSAEGGEMVHSHEFGPLPAGAMLLMYSTNKSSEKATDHVSGTFSRI